MFRYITYIIVITWVLMCILSLSQHFFDEERTSDINETTNHKQLQSGSRCMHCSGVNNRTRRRKLCVRLSDVTVEGDIVIRS